MTLEPTPPTGHYLSEAQVAALLQPLAPDRVARTHDGMSHLEGWDIRAQLNRVLGFARWSADLTDIAMLYEEKTMTKSNREAWRVAWRATVRLRVQSPGGCQLASWTEAAVGEALMPDSKRGDAHDMAIKTAETQALKRCAINLGTRFGLSLYDDAATRDVVGRTLVSGEPYMMPVQAQPTTQRSTSDDQ